MREIKFRFYKPSTGFMKTDSKTFVASDLIEEEDWKVMQFTGLLDKNGKEIYEGDIVRWTSWKLGSNICKEEDYKISEVVWRRKEAWRWNNLDNWEIAIYDDLEVIGNIYENPDLLTQAQLG